HAIALNPLPQFFTPKPLLKKRELPPAWCCRARRTRRTGAARARSLIDRASYQLIALVYLAIQNLRHFGHGMIGNPGTDFHGFQSLIRTQFPDNRHVHPGHTRLPGIVSTTLSALGAGLSASGAAAIRRSTPACASLFTRRQTIFLIQRPDVLGFHVRL